MESIKPSGQSSSSRDGSVELKVKEASFSCLRSPDASPSHSPAQNLGLELCPAFPAASDSQDPHLPRQSRVGLCLTKFSQATSSLEGPEIPPKSPSNLSSQKCSRVGAKWDEALIKAGD